MRYLAFPLALLICGLVGSGLMRVGFAQELAGFTAAQAGQGGVTYSQNCSRCHGENPTTNRYYISVNDVCTPKAGETPDRMLGLDLRSTEFTLDIKSRVMQSSAKLTTAGGLLFSASADRYVRAFDVRDGTVLWQNRVQDVPNAFPITYMVEGKQYVAMIAGNPGLIGNGAVRASAEFMRPEPTSVLWVWQLP